MKYLICEGSNDSVFLKEILVNRLEKKIIIKKKARKVQETFNKRNYDYLKKSLDFKVTL